MGEVFGEDYIIFNQNNNYSIRVESSQCLLLEIHYYDFIKKFRKIIPALTDYFKQRRELIKQIISNNRRSKRLIRAKFKLEPTIVNEQNQNEFDMHSKNGNGPYKRNLFKKIKLKEFRADKAVVKTKNNSRILDLIRVTQNNIVSTNHKKKNVFER